ncbi:sodium/glutamate symporter [Prochlorococcus sp. MIT 1223]|uniref:sodium/glutamate symporter n=1 Tax=Prochlorococcus sp. MIT 1223 TaxID=3096217 RepID=UPI002A74BC98|nr:sodium/glutamate symporter [Prochlorococcus sp. MIT 1223]
MNEIFEIIKDFIPLSAIPSFTVSFGLLVLIGFLLSLGRRLESAMRLERFGIPIALLFGLFALCVGPYGPIPVLPESVTDIWVNLPSPLLTLVFATLMIGRPIPNGKGIWKPVANQALLGFLLGFGQYLVGGLAVLLFLTPYFNVDPLMGCLIEVGFEGGHGAAAIMGQSFEKLGFNGGLDLGLAMATVGLLSSTLIGSVLVVIARSRGWVVFQAASTKEDSIYSENPISFWEQVRQLLCNLGLAGCAVLFAVLMLSFIRLLAPYFGGVLTDVANVFPVFPLALVGSFLIRFILEKTGKERLVSSILQREIGILSTDLLITIAMAGLNLPILRNDWIPLSILAISGLCWNLAGMFIFARITFKEEWFERSLTEFGNATGVAASGLLLLRLADPIDSTKTLPIFSIKQLFLQPLLSGGLITVIAPLVINKIGLLEWTEICGLITILIILSTFIFKLNNE